MSLELIVRGWCQEMRLERLRGREILQGHEKNLIPLGETGGIGGQGQGCDVTGWPEGIPVLLCAQ